MWASKINTDFSTLSSQKVSSGNLDSPLYFDPSLGLPESSVREASTVLLSGGKPFASDVVLQTKLEAFLMSEKGRSVSKSDADICIRFLQKGLSGIDASELKSVQQFLALVSDPKQAMALGLTYKQCADVNALCQQLFLDPIDSKQFAKSVKKDFNQALSISPAEQEFRNKMYLVDDQNDEIAMLVSDLYKNGTLSRSMSNTEIASKLLDYVQSNFSYVQDSAPGGKLKDYWQSIAETFTKKGGDCEDLAIVQASLLMNALQQKGYSRSETQQMVTIAAGYMSSETAAQRQANIGHAVVKFNDLSTGSTLALDATGKSKLTNFDTYGMDVVFEMNQSVFKRYQTIEDTFTTALSIGNIDLTTKAGRNVAMSVVDSKNTALQNLLSTKIDLPVMRESNDAVYFDEIMPDGSRREINGTKQFQFFTIEKHNLGEPGMTGVNQDYYTVQLRADQFSSYFEGLRRNINQMTLMFDVVNSYVTALRDSAFEISIAADDEYSQSKSRDARSEEDKIRQRFATSLNKVEQKLYEGVNQIIDDVTTFVRGANQMQFANIRLRVDMFARKNVAEGIFSELANELTGALDLIRAKAEYRVSQQELLTNAENSIQMVDYTSSLSEFSDVFATDQSGATEESTRKALPSELMGKMLWESVRGSAPSADKLSKKGVEVELNKVRQNIVRLREVMNDAGDGDFATGGGLSSVAQLRNYDVFGKGIDSNADNVQATGRAMGQTQNFLGSDLFNLSGTGSFDHGGGSTSSVFLDLNLEQLTSYRTYMVNYQQLIRTMYMLVLQDLDARQDVAQNLTGEKTSSTNKLATSMEDAFASEANKLQTINDNLSQNISQLVSATNSVTRARATVYKESVHVLMKSLRLAAQAGVLVASTAAATAIAAPFFAIPLVGAVVGPIIFNTFQFGLTTLGDGIIATAYAGSDLGLERDIPEFTNPTLLQGDSLYGYEYNAPFVLDGRAQNVPQGGVLRVFGTEDNRSQGYFADSVDAELSNLRNVFSKVRPGDIDGRTSYLADRGDGMYVIEGGDLGVAEEQLFIAQRNIRVYLMILKAQLEAMQESANMIAGTRKDTTWTKMDSMIDNQLSNELNILNTYKNEIQTQFESWQQNAMKQKKLDEQQWNLNFAGMELAMSPVAFAPAPLGQAILTPLLVVLEIGKLTRTHMTGPYAGYQADYDKSGYATDTQNLIDTFSLSNPMKFDPNTRGVASVSQSLDQEGILKKDVDRPDNDYSTFQAGVMTKLDEMERSLTSDLLVKSYHGSNATLPSDSYWDPRVNLNEISGIRPSNSGPMAWLGNDYREVNYQAVIDIQEQFKRISTFRMIMVMLFQSMTEAKQATLKAMFGRASTTSAIQAMMSTIDTYHQQQSAVLSKFVQESNARVDAYNARYNAQTQYAIEMVAIGGYIAAFMAMSAGSGSGVKSGKDAAQGIFNKGARYAAKGSAASTARQLVTMGIKLFVGLYGASTAQRAPDLNTNVIDKDEEAPDDELLKKVVGEKEALESKKKQEGLSKDEEEKLKDLNSKQKTLETRKASFDYAKKTMTSDGDHSSLNAGRMGMDTSSMRMLGSGSVMVNKSAFEFAKNRFTRQMRTLELLNDLALSNTDAAMTTLEDTYGGNVSRSHNVSKKVLSEIKRNTQSQFESMYSGMMARAETMNRSAEMMRAAIVSAGTMAGTRVLRDLSKRASGYLGKKSAGSSQRTASQDKPSSERTATQDATSARNLEGKKATWQQRVFDAMVTNRSQQLATITAHFMAQVLTNAIIKGIDGTNMQVDIGFDERSYDVMAHDDGLTSVGAPEADGGQNSGTEFTERGGLDTSQLESMTLQTQLAVADYALEKQLLRSNAQTYRLGAKQLEAMLRQSTRDYLKERGMQYSRDAASNLVQDIEHAGVTSPEEIRAALYKDTDKMKALMSDRLGVTKDALDSAEKQLSATTLSPELLDKIKTASVTEWKDINQALAKELSGKSVEEQEDIMSKAKVFESQAVINNAVAKVGGMQIFQGRFGGILNKFAIDPKTAEKIMAVGSLAADTVIGAGKIFARIPGVSQTASLLTRTWGVAQSLWNVGAAAIKTTGVLFGRGVAKLASSDALKETLADQWSQLKDHGRAVVYSTRLAFSFSSEGRDAILADARASIGTGKDAQRYNAYDHIRGEARMLNNVDRRQLSTAWGVTKGFVVGAVRGLFETDGKGFFAGGVDGAKAAYKKGVDDRLFAERSFEKQELEREQGKIKHEIQVEQAKVDKARSEMGLKTASTVEKTEELQDDGTKQVVYKEVEQTGQTEMSFYVLKTVTEKDAKDQPVRTDVASKLSDDQAGLEKRFEIQGLSRVIAIDFKVKDKDGNDKDVRLYVSPEQAERLDLKDPKKVEALFSGKDSDVSNASVEGDATLKDKAVRALASGIVSVEELMDKLKYIQQNLNDADLYRVMNETLREQGAANFQAGQTSIQFEGQKWVLHTDPAASGSTKTYTFQEATPKGGAARTVEVTIDELRQTIVSMKQADDKVHHGVSGFDLDGHVAPVFDKRGDTATGVTWAELRRTHGVMATTGIVLGKAATAIVDAAKSTWSGITSIRKKAVASFEAEKAEGKSDFVAGAKTLWKGVSAATGPVADLAESAVEGFYDGAKHYKSNLSEAVRKFNAGQGVFDKIKYGLLVGIEATGLGILAQGLLNFSAELIAFPAKLVKALFSPFLNAIQYTSSFKDVQQVIDYGFNESVHGNKGDVFDQYIDQSKQQNYQDILNMAGKSQRRREGGHFFAMLRKVDGAERARVQEDYGKDLVLGSSGLIELQKVNDASLRDINTQLHVLESAAEKDEDAIARLRLTKDDLLKSKQELRILIQGVDHMRSGFGSFSFEQLERELGLIPGTLKRESRLYTKNGTLKDDGQTTDREERSVYSMSPETLLRVIQEENPRLNPDQAKAMALHLTSRAASRENMKAAMESWYAQFQEVRSTMLRRLDSGARESADYTEASKAIVGSLTAEITRLKGTGFKDDEIQETYVLTKGIEKGSLQKQDAKELAGYIPIDLTIGGKNVRLLVKPDQLGRLDLTSEDGIRRTLDAVSATAPQGDVVKKTDLDALTNIAELNARAVSVSPQYLKSLGEMIKALALVDDPATRLMSFMWSEEMLLRSTVGYGTDKDDTVSRERSLVQRTVVLESDLRNFIARQNPMDSQAEIQRKASELRQHLLEEGIINGSDVVVKGTLSYFDLLKTMRPDVESDEANFVSLQGQAKKIFDVLKRNGFLDTTEELTADMVRHVLTATALTPEHLESVITGKDVVALDPTYQPVSTRIMEMFADQAFLQQTPAQKRADLERFLDGTNALTKDQSDRLLAHLMQTQVGISDAQLDGIVARVNLFKDEVTDIQDRFSGLGLSTVQNLSLFEVVKSKSLTEALDQGVLKGASISWGAGDDERTGVVSHVFHLHDSDITRVNVKLGKDRDVVETFDIEQLSGGGFRITDKDGKDVTSAVTVSPSLLHRQLTFGVSGQIFDVTGESSVGDSRKLTVKSHMGDQTFSGTVGQDGRFLLDAETTINGVDYAKGDQLVFGVSLGAEKGLMDIISGKTNADKIKQLQGLITRTSLSGDSEASAMVEQMLSDVTHAKSLAEFLKTSNKELSSLSEGIHAQLLGSPDRSAGIETLESLGNMLDKVAKSGLNIGIDMDTARINTSGIVGGMAFMTLDGIAGLGKADAWLDESVSKNWKDLTDSSKSWSTRAASGFRLFAAGVGELIEGAVTLRPLRAVTKALGLTDERAAMRGAQKFARATGEVGDIIRFENEMREINQIRNEEAAGIYSGATTIAALKLIDTTTNINLRRWDGLNTGFKLQQLMFAANQMWQETITLAGGDEYTAMKKLDEVSLSNMEQIISEASSMSKKLVKMIENGQEAFAAQYFIDAMSSASNPSQFSANESMDAMVNLGVFVLQDVASARLSGDGSRENTKGVTDKFGLFLEQMAMQMRTMKPDGANAEGDKRFLTPIFERMTASMARGGDIDDFGTGKVTSATGWFRSNWFQKHLLEQSFMWGYGRDALSRDFLYSDESPTMRQRISGYSAKEIEDLAARRTRERFLASSAFGEIASNLTTKEFERMLLNFSQDELDIMAVSLAADANGLTKREKQAKFMEMAAVETDPRKKEMFERVAQGDSGLRAKGLEYSETEQIRFSAELDLQQRQDKARTSGMALHRLMTSERLSASTLSDLKTFAETRAGLDVSGHTVLDELRRVVELSGDFAEMAKSSPKINLPPKNDLGTVSGGIVKLMQELSDDKYSQNGSLRDETVDILLQMKHDLADVIVSAMQENQHGMVANFIALLQNSNVEARSLIRTLGVIMSQSRDAQQVDERLKMEADTRGASDPSLGQGIAIFRRAIEGRDVDSGEISGDRVNGELGELRARVRKRQAIDEALQQLSNMKAVTTETQSGLTPALAQLATEAGMDILAKLAVQASAFGSDKKPVFETVELLLDKHENSRVLMDRFMIRLEEEAHSVAKGSSFDATKFVEDSKKAMGFSGTVSDTRKVFAMSAVDFAQRKQTLRDILNPPGGGGVSDTQRKDAEAMFRELVLANPEQAASFFTDKTIPPNMGITMYQAISSAMPPVSSSADTVDTLKQLFRFAKGVRVTVAQSPDLTPKSELEKVFNANEDLYKEVDSRLTRVESERRGGGFSTMSYAQSLGTETTMDARFTDATYTIVDADLPELARSLPARLQDGSVFNIEMTHLAQKMSTADPATLTSLIDNLVSFPQDPNQNNQRVDAAGRKRSDADKLIGFNVVLDRLLTEPSVTPAQRQTVLNRIMQLSMQGKLPFVAPKDLLPRFAQMLDTKDSAAFGTLKEMLSASDTTTMGNPSFLGSAKSVFDDAVKRADENLAKSPKSDKDKQANEAAKKEAALVYLQQTASFIDMQKQLGLKTPSGAQLGTVRAALKAAGVSEDTVKNAATLTDLLAIPDIQGWSKDPVTTPLNMPGLSSFTAAAALDPKTLGNAISPELSAVLTDPFLRGRLKSEYPLLFIAAQLKYPGAVTGGLTVTPQEREFLELYLQDGDKNRMADLFFGDTVSRSKLLDTLQHTDMSVFQAMLKQSNATSAVADARSVALLTAQADLERGYSPQLVAVLRPSNNPGIFVNEEGYLKPEARVAAKNKLLESGLFQSEQQVDATLDQLQGQLPLKLKTEAVATFAASGLLDKLQTSLSALESRKAGVFESIRSISEKIRSAAMKDDQTMLLQHVRQLDRVFEIYKPQLQDILTPDVYNKLVTPGQPLEARLVAQQQLITQLKDSAKIDPAIKTQLETSNKNIVSGMFYQAIMGRFSAATQDAVIKLVYDLKGDGEKIVQSAKSLLDNTQIREQFVSLISNSKDQNARMDIFKTFSEWAKFIDFSDETSLQMTMQSVRFKPELIPPLLAMSVATPAVGETPVQAKARNDVDMIRTMVAKNPQLGAPFIEQLVSHVTVPQAFAGQESDFWATFFTKLFDPPIAGLPPKVIDPGKQDAFKDQWASFYQHAGFGSQSTDPLFVAKRDAFHVFMNDAGKNYPSAPDPLMPAAAPPSFSTIVLDYLKTAPNAAIDAANVPMTHGTFLALQTMIKGTPDQQQQALAVIQQVFLNPQPGASALISDLLSDKTIAVQIRSMINVAPTASEADKDMAKQLRSKILSSVMVSDATLSPAEKALRNHNAKLLLSNVSYTLKQDQISPKTLDGLPMALLTNWLQGHPQDVAKIGNPVQLRALVTEITTEPYEKGKEGLFGKIGAQIMAHPTIQEQLLSSLSSDGKPVFLSFQQSVELLSRSSAYLERVQNVIVAAAERCDTPRKVELLLRETVASPSFLTLGENRHKLETVTDAIFARLKDSSNPAVKQALADIALRPTAYGSSTLTEKMVTDFMAARDIADQATWAALVPHLDDNGGLLSQKADDVRLVLTSKGFTRDQASEFISTFTIQKTEEAVSFTAQKIVAGASVPAASVAAVAPPSAVDTTRATALAQSLYDPSFSLRDFQASTTDIVTETLVLQQLSKALPTLSDQDISTLKTNLEAVSKDGGFPNSQRDVREIQESLSALEFVQKLQGHAGFDDLAEGLEAMTSNPDALTLALQRMNDLPPGSQKAVLDKLLTKTADVTLMDRLGQLVSRSDQVGLMQGVRTLIFNDIREFVETRPTVAAFFDRLKDLHPHLTKDQELKLIQAYIKTMGSDVSTKDIIEHLADPSFTLDPDLAKNNEAKVNLVKAMITGYGSALTVLQALYPESDAYPNGYDAAGNRKVSADIRNDYRSMFNILDHIFMEHTPTPGSKLHAKIFPILRDDIRFCAELSEQEWTGKYLDNDAQLPYIQKPKYGDPSRMLRYVWYCMLDAKIDKEFFDVFRDNLRYAVSLEGRNGLRQARDNFSRLQACVIERHIHRAIDTGDTRVLNQFHDWMRNMHSVYDSANRKDAFRDLLPGSHSHDDVDADRGQTDILVHFLTEKGFIEEAPDGTIYVTDKFDPNLSIADIKKAYGGVLDLKDKKGKVIGKRDTRFGATSIAAPGHSGADGVLEHIHDRLRRLPHAAAKRDEVIPYLMSKGYIQLDENGKPQVTAKYDPTTSLDIDDAPFMRGKDGQLLPIEQRVKIEAQIRLSLNYRPYLDRMMYVLIKWTPQLMQDNMGDLSQMAMKKVTIPREWQTLTYAQTGKYAGTAALRLSMEYGMDRTSTLLRGQPYPPAHQLRDWVMLASANEVTTALKNPDLHMAYRRQITVALFEVFKETRVVTMTGLGVGSESRAKEILTNLFNSVDTKDHVTSESLMSFYQMDPQFFRKTLAEHPDPVQAAKVNQVLVDSFGFDAGISEAAQSDVRGILANLPVQDESLHEGLSLKGASAQILSLMKPVTEGGKGYSLMDIVSAVKAVEKESPTEYPNFMVSVVTEIHALAKREGLTAPDYILRLSSTLPTMENLQQFESAFRFMEAESKESPLNRNVYNRAMPPGSATQVRLQIKALDSFVDALGAATDRSDVVFNQDAAKSIYLFFTKAATTLKDGKTQVGVFDEDKAKAYLAEKGFQFDSGTHADVETAHAVLARMKTDHTLFEAAYRKGEEWAVATRTLYSDDPSLATAQAVISRSDNAAFAAGKDDASLSSLLHEKAKAESGVANAVSPLTSDSVYATAQEKAKKDTEKVIQLQEQADQLRAFMATVREGDFAYAQAKEQLGQVEKDLSKQTESANKSLKRRAKLATIKMGAFTPLLDAEQPDKQKLEENKRILEKATTDLQAVMANAALSDEDRDAQVQQLQGVIDGIERDMGVKSKVFTDARDVLKSAYELDKDSPLSKYTGKLKPEKEDDVRQALGLGAGDPVPQNYKDAKKMLLDRYHFPLRSERVLRVSAAFAQPIQTAVDNLRKTQDTSAFFKALSALEPDQAAATAFNPAVAASDWTPSAPSAPAEDPLQLPSLSRSYSDSVVKRYAFVATVMEDDSLLTERIGDLYRKNLDEMGDFWTAYRSLQQPKESFLPRVPLIQKRNHLSDSRKATLEKAAIAYAARLQAKFDDPLLTASERLSVAENLFNTPDSILSPAQLKPYYDYVMAVGDIGSLAKSVKQIVDLEKQIIQSADPSKVVKLENALTSERARLRNVFIPKLNNQNLHPQLKSIVDQLTGIAQTVDAGDLGDRVTHVVDMPLYTGLIKSVTFLEHSVSLESVKMSSGVTLFTFLEPISEGGTLKLQNQLEMLQAYNKNGKFGDRAHFDVLLDFCRTFDRDILPKILANDPTSQDDLIALVQGLNAYSDSQNIPLHPPQTEREMTSAYLLRQTAIFFLDKLK